MSTQHSFSAKIAQKAHDPLNSALEPKAAMLFLTLYLSQLKLSSALSLSTLYPAPKSFSKPAFSVSISTFSSSAPKSFSFSSSASKSFSKPAFQRKMFSILKKFYLKNYEKTNFYEKI